LEYPVLQIGLSSFGHRICPASTPDSSKFFWTCLVIYPDMSSPSAKNLMLDQNFPFGFISSTHLDLRDHVKILWCLKGEEGMVEEVFVMHYLSMWSWAKLLQIAGKGQATKSFWSESRSCHSKLLPGSLFKFLSSHIPIWKCCPKNVLKKRFLMVIQVKIPFWEISILLWAIPCVGSSFHGFQAFKSSSISLKKV
jgi:hypothetical protein